LLIVDFSLLGLWFVGGIKVARHHHFASRWRDGFLAFVLLFDPQKSGDGILGNRDLILR
jgi:hypothetical protein